MDSNMLSERSRGDGCYRPTVSFWKKLFGGEAAGSATEPTFPDARPTPDTARIVLELVDQLRLLHPLAEGRVGVELENVDGVVRIRSMEVPALSTSAPLPETLVLDHGLHTWLASELSAHLLGSMGVRAEGWKRLSYDVRTQSIELLDQTLAFDPEELLFGRAFMRALADIDAVMPERQEALHQRLSSFGSAATSWERESGELAFTTDDGERNAVPAHVLGSYSPEMTSWCWAWANSSFPPEHVRAIQTLADRARSGDVERVLGVGGFPCSEPFAFAPAYLAAERMGEHAVFRWPLRSGVQLFFAVL